MMQEQEYMGNVEKGRSTTTKTEITFQEMLNAIGDSLSDLESSEDKEDGDDEDDDEEDTGYGKLSEDDEPGWVMGTISKTGQHRMECVRQKQLKPDELTQAGWGDTAHYLCERDVKYRTTELNVPAVGKPEEDSTAATPSPTTFGELMQALDIVPGQSQMPQVTSQQGTIQMRLCSEKPQADNHIVLPMPTTVPDSSAIRLRSQFNP
jgi:hypothetical protein